MVYAMFVVACLGGQPMEPQNCTQVVVPTFFPDRETCELRRQRGDVDAANNESFDVAISLCIPVVKMSPPGTHMDG
jgi:hypothetical protein